MWVLQLYSCSPVLIHEYEYEYEYSQLYSCSPVLIHEYEYEYEYSNSTVVVQYLFMSTSTSMSTPTLQL